MNGRIVFKTGVRLRNSLPFPGRCPDRSVKPSQRLFASILDAIARPRFRLLTGYCLYGPRSKGRPIVKASLFAAFTSAGFLMTSGQLSAEARGQVDLQLADERMPNAACTTCPENASQGWMTEVVRAVRQWLHTHVFEPAATGLRFLHLAIIFLPVIITVPAIWVGHRVKDGGDEPMGRLWWYRLLVWSMESAGATFIKLGQWAASRTDIFPPELCHLLSSLHSNAPSHSFEVTKETICRAFGGFQFEEIFEEFDECPLGVGAIAQVYKAKLRSDFALPRNEFGDTADLSDQVQRNISLLVKSAPPVMVPSSYVAVKVLHPGIERMVERDLSIMNFFAKLINSIPTMEWLSFPDEVKQFGYMMRLQLDLRKEASNLSVFRENFKSRSSAWFPYPYEQYTTREVLVEEFAQGIPLATFLKNGAGVYHQEIAHEGLDAFLNMLLIDNFVHSDLHPGNIMVRFYKPHQLNMLLRARETNKESDIKMLEDEDKFVLSRLLPVQGDPKKWNENLSLIKSEGYEPQVVFLDTGLVTELDEINRQNFVALFQAVAEFDGYRAGTLMIERCRQPDAAIDPDVFALRMQNLVLDLKRRTFALSNVSIGDVLGQVLSMVRKHHVRLEGDFVNVVISCLLLEGVGRNLDPDMDLFRSAIPILRRLGSESTMINSVRQGDTSMLRVWLGIEARALVQASVESVERCVQYDLLSPNI